MYSVGTRDIRFFFDDTATTVIYTLSLHDALPIWTSVCCARCGWCPSPGPSCTRMTATVTRSEEHTSELQSRRDLVCRLLLEKKKIYRTVDSSRVTASRSSL